jgi:hypothetical protein
VTDVGKVFEKVEPDLVTRMWLDDVFAGEVAFKGRTTESKALNIPMKYLMNEAPDSTSDKKDSNELLLQKTGKGRVYYRLGLNYAPSNLKISQKFNGFMIQRMYTYTDGKPLEKNSGMMTY